VPVEALKNVNDVVAALRKKSLRSRVRALRTIDVRKRPNLMKRVLKDDTAIQLFRSFLAEYADAYNTDPELRQWVDKLKW
jgi:hypothetical protein